MDNRVTIGDSDFSHITVSHTYVDEGPEELFAKGRYHFNPKWSVEGELRKDLEDDGRTLLSSGSIVYTKQCYRFSFTAERSGYESNDVSPATEYTLNVELLTFGRENNTSDTCA